MPRTLLLGFVAGFVAVLVFHQGTAFLLYQVYDDEAAYLQHRELPHYAEFRILADPWTRSRRVLTYEGVVLSNTA